MSWMLSIRIENKIIETITDIKSKIRSFLLFGNPERVKFGKGVRLSRKIYIGRNVSLRDYTNIRGKNISINDNVFIHENVLIRSNAEIVIGEGTTVNRNYCILSKAIIGKYGSIAPNVVIVGSNHNFHKTDVYIKDQGIEMNGVIIEDDV